MSASSKPTLAPLLARATARLEATVDLPTPPLPLAMAITLRTPGSSGPLGAVERTWEVMLTSTASTPGRLPTYSLAWRSISPFTGQAGVVSSILKLTLPCSMLRSLMKPSETMSRRRSGSWIRPRAPSTSCSVTGDFPFPLPCFVRLNISHSLRPSIPAWPVSLAL
jgi:hypothetical protein